MYDTMTGVKVVEVAGYVLVPAAGAILADWGAEVLKVEHPVTHRRWSQVQVLVGGPAPWANPAPCGCDIAPWG